MASVTERTHPPLEADERRMLEAWLEYHRATLANKGEGLADDQLRARSTPPSSLSLLGLVRHMAAVERGWFRRVMAGEDIPRLFARDDADACFNDVDDASVEEAFRLWRQECALAREVVAEVDSLDRVGKQQRYGADVSLRWILVHMIEEYARHNVHADLLRERIDGAVGD